MHLLVPLFSQVVSVPQQAPSHLVWYIGGFIVLVGLLWPGLQDVRRLSITRIWAIGGVCFAESIRRRILLVTPLAIIGVIIVTQIQNPLDEQDAVRETLKFSLFATGLVLVLTTIILACTSIPKEIETKVIFTIVTKPTSRLEIVLGKIVGFACVSGTVLLIMGLFSWCYLEFRAVRLDGFIAERLKPGTAISTTDRALLEHYQSAGLLEARSLAPPKSVAIYAVDPAQSGNDRWIFATQNQQCIARFDLDDAQKDVALRYGMYVTATVKWEKYQDVKRSDETSSRGAFDPTPPNGKPPFVESAIHPPAVNFQLIDEDLNGAVQPSELCMTPLPTDAKQSPIGAGTLYLNDDGARPTTVTVWLAAFIFAKQIQSHPFFYARIAGQTEGYRYAVDAAHPITLVIRPQNPTLGDDKLGAEEGDIVVSPTLDADKQPMVYYRGQTALFGQQIPGGDPTDDAKLPVAIYTFRGAQSGAVENGRVSMELTSPIDRVDAKVSEQDDPTKVDVTVRSLDNASLSTTVPLLVENRRTSYFDVPADVVASGNFEVLLRDRTEGHYLGLLDDSLRIVTDRQSFALNLFKGLLILWLLSLLVVTISIFSSTFVSWPIAVVLTTVILLGHWVVLTVGEQNSVGLGRQITRDFFNYSNGAQVTVVATSVEKLNSLANTVAGVLPDVSHFDATGELEKGQIVQMSTIGDGVLVLVEFGLPLSVLGYLLIKMKEVAP